MSPSVSDQTTANISNFAPISSNSRSCQHSHTRRSLQLSMTIIRLILIAMLVGVCTASPVRARASAGDASNTPQKVQASFGNRILNYHNVGPKEVVVGYAWLKTGATTRVTPKEILEVEISDVESLANSHAANSDTGSSREPGQNAARKALERLEILLKSLQTINTIEYNYFFPSPNYFDDLVPLGSEQGKGWTQLRNLNQLDMVYIPETVDTNYKMIKKHIESYKDKNEKHNESYTDKNAKLSAVTVLAELGGGHYVLLVPSPGKFRFKVSFDVKATDLPAARWEALNGVKKQRKLQRGIPKQFF